MNSLEYTSVVESKSVIGYVTSDINNAKDKILLRDTLTLEDVDLLHDVKAVIVKKQGAMDHTCVVARILGKTIIQMNNPDILLNQFIYINHSDKKLYFDIPEDLSLDLPKKNYIKDFKDFNFQVSIINHNTIKEKSLEKISHVFQRHEFFWLQKNMCPYSFLAKHGKDKFIDYLKNELILILNEIPKGVYLNFRSLDLRSDEFTNLNDSVINHEKNPQLGLHGIRQLLDDKELLKCEIQTLVELYQEGYNNIIFSLPFVTDIEEYHIVKKEICKITNQPIKLGIFIETPAVVFCIDKFVLEDIFCFYIALKDLTQFILCVDRSNPKISHLYSFEKEAVSIAIQKLIASIPLDKLFLFASFELLPKFIDKYPGVRNYSICYGEYELVVENESNLGRKG